MIGRTASFVFGVILIVQFFPQVSLIAAGVSTWDDPSVFLSAIAAVTGVLLLFGAAISLVNRMVTPFRTFEIRFLDPHGEPSRQKERRAITVRLLSGKSIVRVSIRPRTDISAVTRWAFSCFDNAWFPKRLIPGRIGNQVLTNKIVATRIRRRNEDTQWGRWEQLPIRLESSYWDTGLRFVTGSRQVFDIEYQASESMIGWTGSLGIEIQYIDGENNKHAYVNSKAFISNSGCVPFTFKFRRAMNARRTQEDD